MVGPSRMTLASDNPLSRPAVTTRCHDPLSRRRVKTHTRGPQVASGDLGGEGRGGCFKMTLTLRTGEHKGRPLPKRGSDVAARGVLRTTHIIILKSKDDQQATPVSATAQAHNRSDTL